MTFTKPKVDELFNNYWRIIAELINIVWILVLYDPYKICLIMI